MVARLGNPQIRIRIVIFGELFALIAKVRLDLKLRREGEIEAVPQLPAESLCHLLVGDIGDVSDHARDTQAAHWLDVVIVELAGVKLRVGHDRGSRHLVEGDVLRREVRRSGNDQRAGDPLWTAYCPCERLHAAETATHHRREAPDTQAVGEPRLSADPTLHRYHWQIRPPRPVRRRTDRL